MKGHTQSDIALFVGSQLDKGQYLETLDYEHETD